MQGAGRVLQNTLGLHHWPGDVWPDIAPGSPKQPRRQQFLQHCHWPGTRAASYTGVTLTRKAPALSLKQHQSLC